jgi:surface protein
MKIHTVLIIVLFIVSCSSDEEELPFYVAENGVTIKARDWVSVGTTAELNGLSYTAVDLPSLKEWINAGNDLSKVVTTKVNTLANGSEVAVLFNRDGYGYIDIEGIEGWDVSNWTSFIGLFYSTKPVESDLSSWDVSNVTNISAGFVLGTVNPNINNWDVSNVTTMSTFFFGNIGEKYIEGMDLSGWGLSNVTNCNSFFRGITNWPESKKPNFTNCNSD